MDPMDLEDPLDDEYDPYQTNDNIAEILDPGPLQNEQNHRERENDIRVDNLDNNYRVSFIIFKNYFTEFHLKVYFLLEKLGQAKINYEQVL
jgi:hypothetical protein